MEKMLRSIKKPKILRLETGEHFFVSPLGKGPGPKMWTVSPIKSVKGKMKNVIGQ